MKNDRLSHFFSTRSEQRIFQADIEAGGNARWNRHDANPAVAAAVNRGSFKVACSLASMSNR
jgi:hypothetical protein